MKKKIDNYTFDKVAKTVTFIDYTSIRLDGILLITNVTDNIIIYNFADTLKGGSVLNNILTLDYDTSLMSNSDSLMIYYDDASVVQKIQEQNPLDISLLATANNQTTTINQAIEDADKFQEFISSLKKELDSGELNTIDENLRMVLGTEKLITNKKINVNAIPEYLVVSKSLATVTNSSFMVDVLGYSSLAIQISGTWTGTISFECSEIGSDFVALNGVAVNGATIISTATVNGIYRFNVAGLLKVQVRFSTATTGVPTVTFIASPEPSSIISNTVIIPAITGAVTTTDSILPSSITTQANPAKIIPVAPTLPTSGINNFLASYFPQIFQRLRVESAGSNKVPFKQEEATDKMSVTNDDERVLLQSILRQLEISNIFMFQQLDRNGHPNLRIPEGFNEF